MVHHIAKRQKVDEMETGEEEVLFNSDTLFKIISYLPSLDILNLALTSKRFGISDNYELSVIKKTAHIIVHEIATEEQLAALPHYDGDSTLADYHYLQLLRAPLTFDQLVGGAKYVNSEDKSCVFSTDVEEWKTAFSNNILRAGKHYAMFEVNSSQLGNTIGILVGLMRPGQANQNNPLGSQFYGNFSPRWGKIGTWGNNKVHCCMYNGYSGWCRSSSWTQTIGSETSTWEGKESISSGDDLGMLLDLDEGTLSVYKNGRKLGVMKSGLAGPYCWVASTYRGSRVKIKRGTIPPS